MSGKPTVILAVVAACIMFIVCILPEPAIHMVASDSDNPGNKLPAKNETADPVSYVQDKEKLPEKDYVTSFPGIFDIMPLTLEQTLKVLGSDFRLYENKSQGYDTYVFNKYNLSIEFDKINRTASTIWLDNIPYYIYSGAYISRDLNGDGKPEKIVAYEDMNYNGQIMVVDGASGQYSKAEIEYFGGKCELGVINQNENLILVKTLGARQGYVFIWDNEKLISVLPDNLDSIKEELRVSVEGDKVVLVNQSKNILHFCPVPERLVNSVKGRNSSDAVRINLKINPEAKDNSLALKVRAIVQLKLSDNYNFIDGSYGTYCDVAQVIQEFKYEGSGKWQEISVEDQPKYEGVQDSNVTIGDLSIDKFTLNDNTDKLDPPIKKELESYTSDELNAGVLIKKDGLLIGITKDRITYLSYDANSGLSTKKGISIGDSRQKVIETYGLPDGGFTEDRLWTYYIVRHEAAEDDLSSDLIDTLNLEFTGDEVSRIWMSTHVGDY